MINTVVVKESMKTIVKKNMIKTMIKTMITITKITSKIVKINMNLLENTDKYSILIKYRYY